jgi:hypothetical protein
MLFKALAFQPSAGKELREVVVALSIQRARRERVENGKVAAKARVGRALDFSGRKVAPVNNSMTFGVRS